MRNNVVFQHPAPFVAFGEGDAAGTSGTATARWPDRTILSVAGAGWFVSLLQNVPGLEVDEQLCQDDWGVVVFAHRNRKRFWIGLSPWLDAEHAWLAHVHHGSFAWLQRLSASGRQELDRLVGDFHRVLASSSEISGIMWFRERDMRRADPPGSPTPNGP